MTTIRGMPNPEPCHFCGAQTSNGRLDPGMGDEPYQRREGPDVVICTGCFRDRYPVTDRQRREVRRILDAEARRMLDEDIDNLTLRVKR